MTLFRYIFEVLEMWRFSLTGNEKISVCIISDRKIIRGGAVILYGYTSYNRITKQLKAV